jgi:hypothetical protein
LGIHSSAYQWQQNFSKKFNLTQGKTMGWISQNWVWVLFFVAFIAMHVFGHGCHGGHGDHKSANKDGEQRTPEQGSGHQH